MRASPCLPLSPKQSPAPPLLVVLSGPSGAGKDAVLAELRKLERPWHFALTATTRPMRDGERDGVDYVFLDHDTFARMRERDEFLECAEVYGRWYGVPRSQVRDALHSGKDVILKIDVQGASTIRRMAPEALLIFLVSPRRWDDLRQRLQGRMSRVSVSDLELPPGDTAEHRNCPAFTNTTTAWSTKTAASVFSRPLPTSRRSSPPRSAA